jgi:hypothetical protein
LLPYLIDLLAGRGKWEPISDWSRLLADLNLQLRWGALMPLMFWFVFRAVNENRASSSETRERSNFQPDRFNRHLMFVGCWIAFPIVGVCILDLTGWAPMANARYVQVSLIGFPILAATCIKGSRQLWQRLFLMIAIMAGSLVTNPWQLAAISSGKFPQFRWEDWESPIREIEQNQDFAKAPIFLFANMLEDRDALNRADSKLQQYLKFPLQAVSKGDFGPRSIFCYPTLDRATFLLADLEYVREQQGAWLIVRGDDNLVAEIVSDLMEQLQASLPEEGQNANWTIRQAVFEQSPWNDVRLILLSRRSLNN